MEAKLAAYRQRKEKENLEKKSFVNSVKSALVNLWRRSNKSDPLPTKGETENGGYAEDHLSNGIGDKSALTGIGDKSASTVKRGTKTQRQVHQEVSESKSVEHIEEELHSRSRTTVWVLRILKFFLWLCLWGLFVEIQFGAVFFAISLLIFAYLNTRTGPKDDKPSAYSVFNKDCERIGGTMTAEQLQSQMFGMPGLTS